jgi:hypothetical protein
MKVDSYNIANQFTISYASVTKQESASGHQGRVYQCWDPEANLVMTRKTTRPKLDFEESAAHHHDCKVTLRMAYNSNLNQGRDQALVFLRTIM